MILLTRFQVNRHFKRSCNIRLKSSQPILGPNDLSYFHNPGKHPLVRRTIGQQLSISADEFKNRECLITLHEHGTDRYRMTFAEMKQKVDQLAAGFQQIGLQHGDRVGIWAPNNSHWYLTFLAVARAGLVSVGLNPAYKAKETEYCLKKVNIKALVAPEGFRSQNYYKMLNEIVPELRGSRAGDLRSKNCRDLRYVIIDGKVKLPGTLSFDDIMALPSDESVQKIEEYQRKIDPESVCNIQFTSGTTGSPKAVLLNHFGLVNNSHCIGRRNELGTKHHVALMQVPYFHVYGIIISILASLKYGSTLVVADAGFNAAKSIEALGKVKCSMIYGTPTMYVDLLVKCAAAGIKFDSLEIAVTGGAICPAQLLIDMKENLGVKSLKNVFGMTECTCVNFQTNPGDSEEAVLENVGQLHDHLEAKVIDENGLVVPFGEKGELCLRGYSAMLGYFDDEQKTKETIDEHGWVRTGDLFVLHKSGYGQIVGRIKDLIIRGGENISPREIEDLLMTHPRILECQVVGIPDQRMGEEVCAFIRASGNAKLLAEDIKAFCMDQIAHYKIPKFVETVDEFPKTTSGKIQKFILRDRFVCNKS